MLSGSVGLFYDLFMISVSPRMETRTTQSKDSSFLWNVYVFLNNTRPRTASRGNQGFTSRCSHSMEQRLRRKRGKDGYDRTSETNPEYLLAGGIQVPFAATGLLSTRHGRAHIRLSTITLSPLLVELGDLSSIKIGYSPRTMATSVTCPIPLKYPNRYHHQIT